MVEKKVSKSRKNLQNREKKFGIQKNISEAKKKKKKKWNLEKKLKSRKNFGIERNVSESRNILLQEPRKNLEFSDLEFTKLIYTRFFLYATRL